MRRLIWTAVLSVLLCASSGGVSLGAQLQPIGSFEEPISISSDPGNAERLLVAEREGVILEVESGSVRQLVDLRALVSCCVSERGLLSIVPAPDFDSSGRLYVAYAGTPAAGGQEGDVHLDSFRPGPQGSPPVREPILSVAHAEHPNHNGGQLQFGPDGHLYVALGDGGGSGDPLGSGQDIETLLGKILRIDPHPGQTPAYTIPADNPFVGGPGLDEIWSYGLRNPWRFSFDRASGDMVIGEVGQKMREEVDLAPSSGNGIVGGAGANYGWNCREGFIAYPEAPPECGSLSGFVEPVFDYPHQDPEDGSAHGCSIIGGYVVRDQSLGSLYGRYVYADYCAGELRSLVLPAGGTGLAGDDRSEGVDVASPISFGQDACGRLYLGLEAGEVFRLVGASPASCRSAVEAVSATGQPRPSRLRLSAKPFGKPSGHRFALTALLAPCGDNAGRKLLLKRGGRRIAAKRLSDRCRARFSARVDRRATFRAVLPKTAATARVRSPRRVVRPLAAG